MSDAMHEAFEKRVVFEKWAKPLGYNLEGYYVNNSVTIWCYDNADTHGCWKAWQASIAAKGNNDE